MRGENVILDLSIIALLIILCFIGYKVGFLVTLIKIASGISGLIMAIIFTQPTTRVLTNLDVDSNLENKIYYNITSSEAFVKYNELGANEEGLGLLIEELGIPKFMANIISHNIADNFNPDNIAHLIADNVSFVIFCVITFFGILFFSSLLFFVIKKIVQKTRKKIGVFRFIDGVLGIGFYFATYVIFLYLGFCILYLLMPALPQESSFVIFMKEQLYLGTNQFGIAKHFYEENIFINFFNLLF